MSRKCKVCKCAFEPRLPMQVVCGMDCAKTLAVSVRGKLEKVKAVKERKETREKLDKLKSRATWAREAQAAFNGFIRARDAGSPCISCSRHHEGQYHAGHYLSVGARPELRFNEFNVHKQCAPCNTYLSGNAVLYRKALMEKIGVELVDSLEGPHAPCHYTIDHLKGIKTTYVAKTRALKDQA